MTPTQPVGLVAGVQADKEGLLYMCIIWLVWLVWQYDSMTAGTGARRYQASLYCSSLLPLLRPAQLLSGHLTDNMVNNVALIFVIEERILSEWNSNIFSLEILRTWSFYDVEVR